MSRRITSIALAVSILGLLSPVWAAAAPVDQGDSRRTGPTGEPGASSTLSDAVVDSWVLVRLRERLAGRGPDGTYPLTTGLAELNALIGETGVLRIDDALPASMKNPRDPSALARLGLDRTYRFHVPAGVDVRSVVRELSAAPGVVFAALDPIDTMAATVPGDPRFVEQWGLHQGSDCDVDAPEAWDTSTGGDVLIGVIDSGADDTHPDIDGKLVPGWDFIGDDPDTFPDGTNSHGTHVTSIAAAETDNDDGMAGVCWNCTVMPLKVFDADGNTPSSRTTDAIVWAVDRGVRILNFSGGGESFNQLRLDGLAYARDAGVLFVAAAGNDSALGLRFPARHMETIAVGLTRPDDTRGPASNFGPQLDVVAPGNTILGAVLGGGYETWHGTSMATPHVAGLLGIVRTLLPSVGLEEARYLVRVGSDDTVGDPLEDTPGFDFYHGWGRLNLDATLQATRSASSLRVNDPGSTVLSFAEPDPTAASWDFIRGDLASLREDRYGVDVGTVVCLEDDSPDPATTGYEDTATPVPGEAFFYLARPNGAPGAGSYGGSTLNRDRVVVPLRTEAAAVLDIDQASAGFGSAVGSAGDVNGDGFDDVIVGAALYDGANLDAGAAFVYHGSAAGLVPEAAWTTEGSMVDAVRGWSVAGAGDVNGDGFDDVVVGEPNADSATGRAFVYLGSSTGVEPIFRWAGSGAASGDNFGFSVRSAGDVNADGYDDVVVGAYGTDKTSTDEGAAYLYLGSAAGLSPSFSWVAYGGQASARLGVAVGTAGDVNGDGYDDVVVGSPLYDGGTTNEGRILVYHGSATGLSFTPDWTWETDSYDARLGYSVGTAGDVNSDGYDDLIAGAWYYSGDEPQEGKVFLFLGSAAGLAGSPAWSFELDQGDAQLGIAAEAAGDVDGDGYDDVLVGANFYDGVRSRDGGAWLFSGTPSGLSASPAWHRSGVTPGAEFGWRLGAAGDVDGDLLGDVVIGAPYDSDGETLEGRAFVFEGPLTMSTTDCP